MLTALATSITNAGVTYTLLLVDTANQTVIPSNVNTQLTVAYSGTTSGSGTTYQMGGAIQVKALVLAGTVSSFTGTANTAMSTGSANGAAASATFTYPYDITTDGTNLFVADNDIIGSENIIRQIVIATGAVTTLAGSVGVSGAVDGVGTAATFNHPMQITTDGTNLYVVDSGNNKIRKIVIATGVVSSLTGTANTAMSSGATDGAAASAKFSGLAGITTDGTNLYVAESYKIRKIVLATGVVSSLTGTANTAMSSGSADGAAASATFGLIHGVTTDGINLYVTDAGGVNEKIRKIVIATGMVSSFTGTANTAMSSGAADGAAASATFYSPEGITTDGSNLYVTDTLNHKIRKIVIATGVVSSLTGTANTAMGSGINGGGATDGAAASATFSFPNGITSDGTNLYVTDNGNNKIRMIK